MNNQIIGSFKNEKNVNIKFEGNNNILFIDKNVSISDSDLTFHGDNSVIYLSSSKNSYKIKASIFNNSILYIGSDTYFNSMVHIKVAESQNIVIGNDCLLSFGIWLSTNDAHMIYDINTLKRLNYSKSILIADHVWIGQNSLILKGTKIGSGSIIGGNSVVSNKTIDSNTSWAGNPAKQIRENVFFSKRCTNTFNLSDSINEEIFCIENEAHEHNEYNIFKLDNKQIDFDKLDNEIKQSSTASSKLEIIKNNLVKIHSTNRFYIKKVK